MNYLHAAVVGLAIGWGILICIWFVMGFLYFTEVAD